MDRKHIDALGEKVVGCLIEIHRHLGPGLLESAYEVALCHELKLTGLPFAHQVDIPVFYKGVNLQSNLRIDILVEDTIIVELKAVAQLLPVHQAQILSYLKMARKPLGYLANFHVPLMKNGIQRVANFPQETSPCPPCLRG